MQIYENTAEQPKNASPIDTTQNVAAENAESNVITNSDEQVPLYEKLGIDLETMVQLLVQYQPHLTSAQGQLMTLIIGLTGAGKSTLASYLLHDSFRRVESGGGNFYAEPVNTSTCFIGQNTSSTTSFPQVFEGKDGLAICDCPGFIDNRTIEEAAIVAVNTEMAIKSALGVRGISVVIDQRSLYTTRARDIIDLSNILASILKNVDEVADRITFVISHYPNDYHNYNNREAWHDNAVNVILDRINILKTDREKELKKIVAPIDKLELDIKTTILDKKKKAQLEARLKSYLKTKTKEISELNKQLDVLNLFNRDRVFVVDVFDNGASREKLINRLSKLPLCPITEFNFNRYDEKRRQFDAVIYELSQRACIDIEEYLNLPVKLAELGKMLEQNTATQVFYEGQLAAIEKGQVIGEQAENIIKNKENLKLVAKDIIARKTALDECADKINQVKEQLAEIDNSKLVSEWRQVARGSYIPLLGRFFYIYQSFKYDGPAYEKTVISRERAEIEQTMKSEDTNSQSVVEDATRLPENYDMDIKVAEPDEGRFLADYCGDRTDTNDLFVEILVESRHASRNSSQLAILKARLAFLEDNYHKHNQNLQCLNEQQQILDNTIKKSIEEWRVKILASKIALDKIVDSLKDEIKQLEEKQATIEKTIDENKPLYAIIKEICEFLDYSEKEVGEFKKYKKKLEDHETLHRNAGQLVQVEIPAEYRCKLSQKVMDEPVSANCGDIFDRTNIIKYVKANTACPCCQKNLLNDKLPSIDDNFKSETTLKEAILRWKESENVKQDSANQSVSARTTFFTPVPNSVYADKGSSLGIGAST